MMYSKVFKYNKKFDVFFQKPNSVIGYIKRDEKISKR